MTSLDALAIIIAYHQQATLTKAQQALLTRARSVAWTHAEAFRKAKTPKRKTKASE